VKLGAYDVGYSARPTAGIGQLLDGKVVLERVVGGPAAFGRLEFDMPYDVIAIDGPIIPKEHDASLVRTIEGVFQRGKFQRRCKCAASHVPRTGQQLRAAAGQAADSLAKLSAVALDARGPLVRSGRIVEAFPNAFLGVCVPEDAFERMPKLRRGKKFDWLYDQWLEKNIAEQLRLRSQTVAALPAEIMRRTSDHEERAALVCLMTAACVADGSYSAVGDDAGGWFFLPPWSMWADWAKDEADRQVERSIQVGQHAKIITEGST
jgi:hypothetical protein